MSKIAAKPKSAAQIARRERNIELANQRLARLQAKQKLVKELKALGYKGSDDNIIAQFSMEQREAEASQYVSNVLAHPKHGQIIRRWLAQRINQAPIYVKELIDKFLERDRNAEIAADMSEYLDSPLLKRINDHRKSA